MDIEFLKHQSEALDFLAGKPAAMIGDEMGLGKTLVVLAHLKWLRDEMEFLGDAPPFPTLVVCPLSAVSVWEREVIKFGYQFKVMNLTGPRMSRIKNLATPADIYIINFEGLRLIPNYLMQKGFRTLICDESHRLKERGAQQSKVARELSRSVPRRYLLSGTPVTKSPEDIWGQFNIIDPKILGDFFVFRARYIELKSMNIRVGGSLRTIHKAIRFKNLPELKERIKPWFIRRTKEECLDLPEKIYKTIPCPMTPVQFKHYHSLKKSLATMLEDKQLKMNNAAALVQKLRQVCQGFLYDADQTATYFDGSKLPILKDLLVDLSTEKVIVFTWFKADLFLLHTQLSKERRVILYEGTSQERAEKEKDFQEAQDFPIFLANIEVAKESITLTAASHVIYYSNTWNYASRKQSEDRAHRFGQKRSVIYYDLVCPSTIDESVAHVLQHKGKMADKILGDTMRLAMMAIEKGEQYE